MNTTKPYTMYKGQMAIIELPKNRSESFDLYLKAFAEYTNLSHELSTLVLDLQDYSVHFDYGVERVGISEFDELSEDQKIAKMNMLESRHNELEYLANMYETQMKQLYLSLSNSEKNFARMYLYRHV